MSNLQNFNNLYADLAESAYNGRPSNFPYEQIGVKQQEILDSGKSIKFNFSQDGTTKNSKGNTVITKGGTNLPNSGIVYLQPDKTLHTVEVTTDLTVPNPNGGYHTDSYVTSTYQQGLLTDERAGFNAYFITDTPTLNSDTQNVYLAIRGSDAMTLENWNDWVDNDANFALNNAHIPQAPLATEAMKAEIA
ncbi:MAG: hypothetical protein LBI13_07715 [Streptococcaceae bacterium]|jgi:hypothetical protein|nr:hypothetical protein [Streptococcaceae bacterium]